MVRALEDELAAPPDRPAAYPPLDLLGRDALEADPRTVEGDEGRCMVVGERRALHLCVAGLATNDARGEAVVTVDNVAQAGEGVLLQLAGANVRLEVERELLD